MNPEIQQLPIPKPQIANTLFAKAGDAAQRLVTFGGGLVDNIQTGVANAANRTSGLVTNLTERVTGKVEQVHSLSTNLITVAGEGIGHAKEVAGNFVQAVGEQAGRLHDAYIKAGELIHTPTTQAIANTLTNVGDNIIIEYAKTLSVSDLLAIGVVVGVNVVGLLPEIKIPKTNITIPSVKDALGDIKDWQNDPIAASIFGTLSTIPRSYIFMHLTGVIDEVNKLFNTANFNELNIAGLIAAYSGYTVTRCLDGITTTINTGKNLLPINYPPFIEYPLIALTGFATAGAMLGGLYATDIVLQDIANNPNLIYPYSSVLLALNLAKYIPLFMAFLKNERDNTPGCLKLSVSTINLLSPIWPIFVHNAMT
jgi:hypothetical protein